MGNLFPQGVELLLLAGECLVEMLEQVFLKGKFGFDLLQSIIDIYHAGAIP